jgi:hypothetical protein
MFQLIRFISRRRSGTTKCDVFAAKVNVVDHPTRGHPRSRLHVTLASLIRPPCSVLPGGPGKTLNELVYLAEAQGQGFTPGSS